MNKKMITDLLGLWKVMSCVNNINYRWGNDRYTGSFGAENARKKASSKDKYLNKWNYKIYFNLHENKLEIYEGISWWVKEFGVSSVLLYEGLVILSKSIQNVQKPRDYLANPAGFKSLRDQYDCIQTYKARGFYYGAPQLWACNICGSSGFEVDPESLREIPYHHHHHHVQKGGLGVLPVP